MKRELTYHDTAVIIDGRVWRLKDLLPPDTLRLVHGGILAAESLSDKDLALTVKDGSQHIVPSRVFTAAASPQMSDHLLLRHVGQLLTLHSDDPRDPLGLRHDVQILCEGGRVVEILPAEADVDIDEATTVLDAAGRLVTPGLVDPHTHPVFAGERSHEFAMKAAGATYLDIHKAGGGIYSTVKATRAASFDELLLGAWKHMDALLAWGVTTCEGKSGYALSTAGELRLLEVLRALDASHPVDVIPTLLGAHTLPQALADRRGDYIAEVVEEMIPAAASRHLARFCDAYCEEGAFTIAEVERIFTAAQTHGLGLRLHAEQFTHQGGAELAGHLGAASADHLEAISDEGIEALAKGHTTAVLLPGATMTCRAPWAPATKLIEAGVPLALGTDLNPGSSMTANLPLMMSLACMQMGVSCELAWRATTLEAAKSLGLDDVGFLAPGSAADLVIFDASDYRQVPYHYGENLARTVIKRGRVVSMRGDGLAEHRVGAITSS